MSTNVNEIWDMINSLTPAEKKVLYQKMQEDINKRLNDILDNVNERSGDDPVDFDIITEEVEWVRGRKYDQS